MRTYMHRWRPRNILMHRTRAALVGAVALGLFFARRRLPTRRGLTKRRQFVFNTFMFLVWARW